jgi:hypothetical protein
MVPDWREKSKERLKFTGSYQKPLVKEQWVYPPGNMGVTFPENWG